MENNTALTDPYLEWIESIASVIEEHLWPGNTEGLATNIYVDGDEIVYDAIESNCGSNRVGNVGSFDVEYVKVILNYYQQIDNLLQLYGNGLNSLRYNYKANKLTLVVHKEFYGFSPIESVKIQMWLKSMNNSDFMHYVVDSMDVILAEKKQQ